MVLARRLVVLRPDPSAGAQDASLRARRVAIPNRRDDGRLGLCDPRR